VPGVVIDTSTYVIARDALHVSISWVSSKVKSLLKTTVGTWGDRSDVAELNR
jgi:hypothetical protein